MELRKSQCSGNTLIPMTKLGEDGRSLKKINLNLEPPV